MDALSGPVWAAFALLAIAGAPKVLDPFDTLRAVRATAPRLRIRHHWIRAFGALETVLGVLGLLTGHRVLLALAALSYLGFTAFVVVALRRSTPLSSCGCFGKADTPPTWLHVALTGLLALLCGSLAVTAAPVSGWATAAGVVPALATDSGPALLTGVFAATICVLLYLALAVLPTVGARPAVLGTLASPGGTP